VPDPTIITLNAVDTWTKPLPPCSGVIEAAVLADVGAEAPPVLKLKVDAQVVVTRNLPALDLDNGSRGSVIDVTAKGDPVVRFAGGRDVAVPAHAYHRTNPGGVEGAFVRMQHPLALAYAATVHKSQGQTLERAVLDVGDAFTYVWEGVWGRGEGGGGEGGEEGGEWGAPSSSSSFSR
jgi:hypothetical protein